MTIMKAMDISLSGMTAQRVRLNVTAENLANVHTTRTPEGGPYLRKCAVLASAPEEDFPGLLETTEKVEVAEILPDPQGLKAEHNPGHPDADANGQVLWPNVDPIMEMVNLMVANRAFDANVAVFRTARAMALKALDIGR
jgi:flagellar basal-body rod protein FlgC